ncbi:homoserine kinase [Candidatus Sulfurimonas marisnigri]|uniref:Homoserine kinase n=1 Tax=Candidatus Sulfurimonas marisnigri TaxID=2740405 RepID=A0A7S7M2M1_9BACT|nr:homoserine kinase [Candidatus Sulfurimonas marisnigri]QOY55428.1 homoserine kinase [Candidatus Sulfurimonas marisnigri]
MTISVPATSANLGPGFDSLGLAVDLRNIVEFHQSKFFSVCIKGEGENNPRLKGNNLFVSIFNEHYDRLTKKKQNFKFTFYNQIPMSRGLGSSSAVIVSAIASAHEAAGIRVSKRRILNHALVYESHPDNITPAVMGGFNAATVEKNKVFSQKKHLPNYIKAVVVIPNKPISTAKARTLLPKSYSKENAIYNLSHTALSVAAFFNEDWEILKLASQDRFHQKARMKALPELFNVQKIAYESGALMSTLSGSGSTFFSMVYDEDSAVIASKLKQKFPDFIVKELDFDNDGLIIER